MKKNLSIVLIFVLVVSMLTACTQGPEAPETPEGPLSLTDPAGNEIVLPENVDRIMSLAPAITEIIMDIGHTDKIIAADTQSEGIEGLPEAIPYMDMMAPDVEQIIALDPDIILASTITIGGGDDPLAQLKDLGITVAYIPSSNSIDEIYRDISFVSSVLAEEEKGQELIDETQERIGEIKAIGDTIEDKKSVYFEIAAAPYLYSFGNGVFLHEMIEIVGANNALADQESWIPVAEEVVVAANPDIILTNVNYIEDPVEEIKARDGWQDLNAVKDNQVYYIDNSSSSLPNHNIVKALEQMAEAIYPDKY